MSTSYYVKRGTSYGFGWTGPLRSKERAEHEAEAWRSFGTTAEVVQSTPEVVAEVHAWQRSREENRRRLSHE